jgi:glycosyltransferase involved in cell wall biosynthesis
MHHPNNIIETQYFAETVDFASARGWKKWQAAVRAIYNTNARDQFARLVHDFRPDVVHLHNVYHHLSFSILDVVKQEKIPTVMTLHDYKIINPNYTLFRNGKIDERGGPGHYYQTVLFNTLDSLSKSIVATIEAYVRQWKGWNVAINAYISPSQFLKEKWQHLGWNSQKVHVVPYPIDITELPFVPHDNGLVTFSGRLVVEKGIMVFLDVALRLPNISFCIIGDGPLRGYVQEQIEKKLLTNVVSVPWVEKSILQEYIGKSRIVVVPSLWYETSSLAGLEAMSMGKVVIGSDIGALREVINAPFRVPAGSVDALAREIERWYYTSSQERYRLGEMLRKNVDEIHNPERYIQSVINIYKSVVSNS